MFSFVESSENKVEHEGKIELKINLKTETCTVDVKSEENEEQSECKSDVSILLYFRSIAWRILTYSVH